MDVYAFRIVVDDVDTCYRVLGMVHNLYKPVAVDSKITSRFLKPMVINPSHHLFGMHGLPIEIQIRTEEMEEFANHGIAGHGCTKQAMKGMTSGQHRARAWMRGLLELQQNAGNSLEFIENVKIDLFPDEVYSSVRQATSTSYPRARPR